MSFLVCITIPISNYYGDDVFEKRFYFECENKSPTKEQMINALTKLHKEFQQYPGYYGEEFEALEIVESIANDKWRYVSPTGIVETNIFINHPKFGEQPFDWKIIRPIKLIEGHTYD